MACEGEKNKKKKKKKRGSEKDRAATAIEVVEKMAPKWLIRVVKTSCCVIDESRNQQIRN